MKKIFLGLLVVALMTSLWSNGQNDKASSASSKDLVVAVGVEPTHYIPIAESGWTGDLDQVVLYNVFDTLVYKDLTDGSIKPWIAKSWDISPDGKTLKFNLRDDVYFHDGTKMTAADIKWTYDTAVQYGTGNGLLVGYDYTEIVDDYNIIMHMKFPYEAILNGFACRAAGIMSKSHFEKVGSLAAYEKTPVGTGAYKFVSVKSGDSIVLQRFEKYWGGVPAYNQVTIKTISDINTQILALESGNIDVIINAPVEDVLRIKNPKVSVDTVGSNATLFMEFNLQETRWASKDLNFRKAVQYALDKESINNAIFGGKGVIVDTFGATTFTGRPPAGSYSTYTRNVAKAKEFLAASDYDGQPFNIVCTAGSAIQKSAEIIQGTLAEVGINAKVIATDAPTFFDTVSNTGEYDADLVINTSSVLDMDFLSLKFVLDRYVFKNMNIARAQELNDLLLQARVEPDSKKRMGLYGEAISIINEDVLAIYILTDVNTLSYRTGMKGVVANMAKYYRFSEWSY